MRWLSGWAKSEALLYEHHISIHESSKHPTSTGRVADLDDPLWEPVARRASLYMTFSASTCWHSCCSMNGLNIRDAIVFSIGFRPTYCRGKRSCTSLYQAEDVPLPIPLCWYCRILILRSTTGKHSAAPGCCHHHGITSRSVIPSSDSRKSKSNAQVER